MSQQSPKEGRGDNPHQASEELYQVLFDQAADGIFIADRQGHCIDVNRHGCKMLGYTRKELLGVSMEDLVTAEDLIHNPPQLDAMRAGKTLLRERHLRCKDGRFLPVEISARMLTDGRFLSIVRDISERKQAEEKLRESNERFRLLAESSLTGIYLIQDNRFRYVNPALAHMFGYEVEEIVEKLGPMDLVSPDDRPLVAENVRRRIEGEKESIHYDFRGLRKDGSVIDIEVHGRRIEYGGKIGVIGTLIDITERKLAEEKIVTSEQLFRTLVENSPDRIARYDRNFRRTYVNPAMISLFQQPIEDVLSKTPADHSPIHTPQVYLDYLQQVFDTATECTFEMPYRTSQGEMNWGHMRLVPEFDPNGQVVSVLGIGHDIHEIKENELRFRMLAENYPDFIIRLNQDCQYTYVNPSVEKAFGLPAEAFIGKTIQEMPQHQNPEQNDVILGLVHQTIDEGITNEAEIYWDTEIGKRIFKIRYVPEKDVTGKVISILGIAHDITVRKQAEQEHLANLHFFESMNQVNQAVQGTNDLEQMMRNVLDTVLSIFDCDRAALVYPCDPEAATWQAPMERTKPEWPGVHALGLEMPLDSSVANAYKTVLASNDPVGYGPGNEHRLLSTDISKRFAIASQLVTAVYPKVDKPYMFVIHQCSHPRVWTPEERRLFKEISRRLADALTSLLAYRNLRESERKLAEAERIAHVGWWDRNYEADNITLSDEGHRIFGLPLKEDHQQIDLNQWQQQWKELIHPEDRSRAVHAAEEALRGGPRYDLEYRVVRPNGEIRFIRSEGDVTWDESGQPRRMFGIMQDITELRQTENELQASEARFRTLVDHAADAFYLHDSKGAILDVNQQACRSLGYSREELIGMHPKELDAALDSSLLAQLEAQLDTGEEVAFETRHRRKDGTEFPVEVRGRPFWQGERRYSVSLARDISERKRAQEALTLFRTLIDHTYDAIEVIDPETGRFLDANEQAYQALGYTREEFLNLSVPEINPLVAEQSWQKMLEEIRQSGSIVRESQHLRKDGSIFPIEININYIHLDRDYILAVVRDITKRKQVEEALRESEERLRQITSSLREAVWLRDVQTRQVLYVNPAFQELTGRTCESFYEDRDLVIDAVHPDDKEWVREALDQRFEKIPFGKEHRIIHLDGSVRWVSSQVFPVRNEEGEVYRWASIMEDITERKRAEEALRASEERYRALYRDNPSMFFTLDGDGVIISVNAFGASQLGYTIDELEGQSILGVFFKDDRTAVINQLQYCVQNPGQTSRQEFRKMRKDGSLLWIDEFARAITAPNGTINILIVCQDITDRKQAEVEQKRLLTQIQEQAQQVRNIINTVPEGVILLSKDQSVTVTNPIARQYLALLAPEFENGRLTHLGQRPLPELLTSPPEGLWHEIISHNRIFEAITRPIEYGPDNGGWVLVLHDITQERDIQQRVQRQERLAAVGQLAAGIAHDFNNILAVITLYTQLISRTTELPVRIQERLHTIEQQANRATDLIQQILDFGRQSILERQPLDLISFMQKLVTLLERTLPEHIQIGLVYSAEAYFIQADPSRIQQVIMNLAVNARDAMPKGGNLTIRLAYVQTDKSKPMSVQDLPPGDWIQIEVMDSGDGIPQETISHIFEPFFTTKEVGEGTGLGLAQVYGIVQQHDGYIDVVTEVGQGTTFVLYFPALNIGIGAIKVPDQTAFQLGQGQKILLVEDNQVTREALQDSLDQLNYEVLAATNGREALTILVENSSGFDLVLSDVVMPEMGGVALFHAMKEQNLTIPMVLLTGHPLSKEMDNLQAMGLAGWLPKPLDLVNLSYLLAKILTV